MAISHLSRAQALGLALIALDLALIAGLAAGALRFSGFAALACGTACAGVITMLTLGIVRARRAGFFRGLA